jgi:hypothetical protein
VLDFYDGEGVKDCAMWLMGMVNQLIVLSNPELEDKVVLKFLRIAHPRFKQPVISIETLLDVSTLMLEEVTGQLRLAEEDSVVPPVADGNLYLTKKEWAERHMKKDADVGSSSGGGHSGGDGAGASGEKGNYYQCGKLGHQAWVCQSKQPKKDKEEQAFMAQWEELTLLYAEIESEVLPRLHRSGGGGWISDGDVGCGAPDQWSVRIDVGISSPAGAHVLEQGGAATQV